MNAAAQQVTVKLNPVFRQANKCRKRYRVLKGSAGSGKSVNIATDYILKLMDPTFAGANLLVVRKVEATHRDSTFAELRAAIFRVCGDAWPVWWEFRVQPLEIRCKVTGAKVLFRGTKDTTEREKLKSISVDRGKITWIWVEEATELEEQDIDILDDRLRGILPNPNLYYQMTFTFNPVSASHWIKRRYFDTVDPDVMTHHSTYLENRFIDAAYHRRMEQRRRLDPEGFRVYGLGEWGELSGLILTNYEVKDFNPDPSRFDSYNYGQDFGYNHANAILGVGWKDGDLYVCSEIYVHEMDTGEIIKLAGKREIKKNAFIYCDSAEPDRIKTWKAAGYKAMPVKKGPGSVKAQIDFLKRRRIYIHPSCTNTLKEIQSWKWKRDPKTGVYMDEPVEIFDDAMAALRYAAEPIRNVKTFGATNRL